MHIRIIVLAALLCGVATSSLAAAAPAVEREHAQTIEELQERFQKLHRSLRARGGFSPEDQPIIRDLRDRYSRFNSENPNHEAGLAGELQLSLWLSDDDRADQLFDRLVRTAPDNPRYGLMWIRHLEARGRTERVHEVYEWLLANTQDTTELRMGRAQQHVRNAEYAQALALIEEANPDPASHPDAWKIKAEALSADHRFDEALAALQAIPDEALSGRMNLRRQIENAKREYRELSELWANEQELRSTEAAADDLPRVELITSRGRIVVELFEDSAPNTVANFISLVEDGFYNETRFHRVERGFVTQGGDPNTKPDGTGPPGTGGPGYRILDEWDREGARKHFAGSLAMAHSGPDTAGSQFYITHRPTPGLNRGYTVFGRVLEGLEIARRMEVDDALESARVLRKRDHEYAVEKLPTIEETESDLPSYLRTRPR